jgi:hypothetical protein
MAQRNHRSQGAAGQAFGRALGVRRCLAGRAGAPGRGTEGGRKRDMGQPHVLCW